MTRFDYLIAGGGLHGGMIALALRHYQPQARIALIERSARLGGNHIWSFHALDVPVAAECFVNPLVSASWPRYQVRFPGFSRVVRSRYSSIRSERFADCVTRSMDSPGQLLMTGADVRSISRDGMSLGDGRCLEGSCVIDCRGQVPEADPPCRGYQKFLGIEFEITSPGPDSIPTVMDATVPQDDGFQFLYTLPMSPNRVLVEDTCFSDRPDIDRTRARARIIAELEARHVSRWRIVREESGVLPMPWSDTNGFGRKSAGTLRPGFAGGWFHPATGYSLPLAVRLALTLSRHSPDRGIEAADALAARLRTRHRFARFLNFLLFRAVKPEQRWRIFRRLYRDLPDARMARFYSMDFTTADAFRIMAGWPPPLAPLRPFRRMDVSSCPLT